MLKLLHSEVGDSFQAGSPPQIAVDIDDEEGEDLVEYDDIPAPNSIELEQNPEPELDRAEETETQKDKPELDRAEKRTDKASSSQPAKPVAKKKDTPPGPPPYKPPLPFQEGSRNNCWKHTRPSLMN
ncbi:unnamed protein product [Microthlaspi erraticum]|uniref:Uncharacterized protein n=1 Tax=Microthlaspi erraticum TaxID=1685480 RepID=A0A6D2JIN5_9BRAS|nr:unnamed protein product [Microthlaspi erraticum]